jgi:hypothetical protein
MKIITKSTIDMETLEILIESSYEYNGPVSLCGSSGGGAGKVDYPTHMKEFHSVTLNHTGTDNVTSSLVDITNSMLGNSPYIGDSAYNPDARLSSMECSLTTLETLVNLLSSGTGLDSLVSNILSDSRIDNAVDEYSLDLADRLTSEVLPRFEAGMRDINAVTSSAFAIGRAVIEDGQTRQVAKYSADLHMKAFSDDALQLIALKLEYQKNATHMGAEIRRIGIVAKKEEREDNTEIAVADALWDLELFQYGGNFLASIGAATVQTGLSKGKPSKAASAIGGGLSGAAAGAMIGAKSGSAAGYWGAGIGAVVGAAAGLLTS